MCLTFSRNERKGWNDNPARDFELKITDNGQVLKLPCAGGGRSKRREARRWHGVKN